MRQINYQLTNTIVNNLIDLETTKCKISQLDLSDEIQTQLNKKQKKIDIFHTAHMLGLNITLKDTEKFLVGKIDTQNDLKNKILNNFKNAIEYIRSNRYDNYVNINKDLVLHLNKLLIYSWKEPWEAKFRVGTDIDSSFDDWLTYGDQSIKTNEIEAELDNTFEWYKNNTDRINPIIRTAVTIYRLIRIIPFSNLNKLTIIAICDFLLQKNEYSTITYLSVPKLFDLNQDEFKEQWEKSSNSPTGNITFWIEKFTEHIAAEFENRYKRITKQIETNKKRTHQPFLNLNKRQLKILKYLQTIPSVKRQDYVQMFDVSTMTAYRDLNELLKKKLIKVEGKGRATKYSLANR
ncbi:DeoR family transcriptional regulator [Candidatus Dojkabacteria bacterium]|nr:DeoR family transcriptional regulator [Candidatus Dojkabacteria bacterium]